MKMIQIIKARETLKMAERGRGREKKKERGKKRKGERKKERERGGVVVRVSPVEPAHALLCRACMQPTYRRHDAFQVFTLHQASANKVNRLLRGEGIPDAITGYNHELVLGAQLRHRQVG